MPTFDADNSKRDADTARAAVNSGAVYSRDYYDAYGDDAHRGYFWEIWAGFFNNIADQIVARLAPRRTLDVGCAKGFLVGCLRDRGVDAYGIDVSEYAISQVRPDIKPFCRVASATEPITDNYDLITCVEVCEHLTESDAVEAIRQMTSHSEMILFSSTPGHFDDATHINVRPIIDWLRLFAQFSFAPDWEIDASFVAPQAMLLRRVQVSPEDRELRRFAQSKNELEVLALQRELDAVLNSKGWKLLNLYRDWRARVKRPIAQGLRKLGLL